jgi:hypothetical protein
MSVISDINGVWDLNTFKTGQDEILQNVRNAILDMKGTYFLNEQRGIDWINVISDENILKTLEGDLYVTILNVEGVVETNYMSIYTDEKTGNLKIDYTLYTIYNIESFDELAILV